MFTYRKTDKVLFSTLPGISEVYQFIKTVQSRLTFKLGITNLWIFLLNSDALTIFSGFRDPHIHHAHICHLNIRNPIKGYS